MIDATFEPSDGSFYFRQGPWMPIFNTIDLGNRTVTLDIDPNGHITGIKVV